MKRIFLLLTVLYFAFSAYSQNVKFASSSNSNFFATLLYKGKTDKKIKAYKNHKEISKTIKVDAYELNIFKIKTKEWLRSFNFTLDPKLEPEKIGLSNNGLVCYIKIGNNTSFWNIVKGKKILDKFIDNCYFPASSDYFVTTLYNTISIIDVFSGKTVKSFKVPGIKKIEISKNDKYIIAEGEKNRTTIININKDKRGKNLRANEFLISDNIENVSFLIAQSNTLNIEKYSLRNKKKILKFNVASYIRILNSDERKKMKSSKANSYIPFLLHSSKCKLSSDDKSVVLYLTKTVKKDSIREFLFIVNINNQKITNIISSSDYKGEIKLRDYTIYNKQSLIIPMGEHAAGIYDIKERKILNTLWYLFEKNIYTDRFSIRKQIKKRHISPNYKYVIIESNNHKNPVIYAKPTAIEQAYSKIENVLFLAYSKNSKYLFVQKQNNKFAFVKTFDISANINSNLKLHSFADTLTYAVPEDIIDEDGIAPSDYNYVKINGFKHISELGPKTNIYLHFKTMALSEMQSGIQLHLIDKNGIYYHGASEKEWLHIWKKLLVQFTSDNSIKNIEDFKVTEQFGNDSLPNKIALVLDHSGSMGDERTVAIQQAALEFIKKKAADDRIAIIKYDGKVGLDVGFSQNSKKLVKAVKITGLKGYGGATSLLDAVAFGTNILKENNEKANKSVVVLTDGNENSSYLNKGDVLKYANVNGVKINTIGFGSFVNEDYLKALSYYSQGSFYQIYNTSDFNWIFNDIYKKMNHYYTISFDTDKIGEYKAVLEIAIDSTRKDTMVTVFKTDPVDYTVLNQNIDSLPFMPPVTEYEVKEVNISDIVEFSDSIEENKVIIERKIVEEFEEIEFPVIKFIFKETNIVEGTERGLENLILFMHKHKNKVIEISGHTDNVGNNKKNLELSKLRAEKVKELIVIKGIEQSRIITKGFGETKPLFKNNTDEGRQKNRRVEFKIVE